jgi:two-component system NarL family response regulator
MSALRLFLVDDHALLRAGLAAVLQNHGFLVCGEASSGTQAVARYEELRPDVTLIDLQMPDLDGAGAIARIRERHPEACFLVLTTFDTDEDIERALRAGARGYLLKDAAVDELATAIREVHAGRTRVAPAVAAKLAGRVTQVQLTMRERRSRAGRRSR